MTLAKPVLAAAASLGLAAAPVAAQSTQARAASAVADGEQLAGSALLYVFLAAAAIGVILIVSDNDEDIPTSP